MIGHRIHMHLVSQEKRVADLARFCGVSAAAVYQWLADEAEPKSARRAMIAKFFKIDPQQLEYGPVLSLVHATTPSSKKTTLTYDMSLSAANLIIAEHLNTRAPRSEPYRLGLLNQTILLLSGIDIQTPYSEGTAEADAYNAGMTHADNLFDHQELSKA